MLQPKYKIGEKVWILEYSIIENKIITGIFYDRDERILYCFDKEQCKLNDWFLEHRIYPTKESLISDL